MLSAARSEGIGGAEGRESETEEGEEEKEESESDGAEGDRPQLIGMRIQRSKNEAARTSGAGGTNDALDSDIEEKKDGGKREDRW